MVSKDGYFDKGSNNKLQKDVEGVKSAKSEKIGYTQYYILWCQCCW